MEKTKFRGGCFWGAEPFLREVPGLEIPHPVQTNIIIAELNGLGIDADPQHTATINAAALRGQPGSVDIDGN